MAPTPDHTLHIRGNDGLTNTEIGAVIGSLLGFTIIVLFTICCCVARSRAPHRHHRPDVEKLVIVDSPPLPHPLMAKVRWSQRNFDIDNGRIPGGPKYPTYRALPIPNPRNNPNVQRNYAQTYQYY